MLNVLPSRRLLGLLALAAALFLVDSRLALAANGLLVAAAVGDAAGARARRDLRVHRRVPERVSLGGEAEVRWTVESASTRPLSLRLTDDPPACVVRLGADVWPLELAPRGRVEHSYGFRAERRGEWWFGDAHLRVLGPLGLVWRQCRMPLGDRLQVQPGMRELQRHRALTQKHRLREAGLRAVRDRGAGTSFESLRDYLPGDDPRHIDWKATARRAIPTVRQFEAERSQNLMLAVDAGRLMTERIGERERLDHALSACLLLADVAARHGDRVGFFVFADRVQQFVPPRRASLSLLAEAFARVEGRVVEPDYPAAFAFLSASLRRRSLLVVFTDVIDARASAPLLTHLRAASRRHLPLVVTMRNPAVEEAAERPAVAEADVFGRAAAEELLQARAHALVAMQRSGVLVADSHPGDAVVAVVNRYLEVKRRGLL